MCRSREGQLYCSKLLCCDHEVGTEQQEHKRRAAEDTASLQA